MLTGAAPAIICFTVASTTCGMIWSSANICFFGCAAFWASLSCIFSSCTCRAFTSVSAAPVSLQCWVIWWCTWELNWVSGMAHSPTVFRNLVFTVPGVPFTTISFHIAMEVSEWSNGSPCTDLHVVLALSRYSAACSPACMVKDDSAAKFFSVG